MRNATLFINELIDGALELGSFGLCGSERKKGFLLLMELIGSCGNNSVVRPDRAELLVEGNELALMGGIADSCQVFCNFPLGGVYQIAQGLQAVRVIDERGFRQKAGEEI